MAAIFLNGFLKFRWIGNGRASNLGSVLTGLGRNRVCAVRRLVKEADFHRRGGRIRCSRVSESGNTSLASSFSFSSAAARFWAIRVA